MIQLPSLDLEMRNSSLSDKSIETETELPNSSLDYLDLKHHPYYKIQDSKRSDLIPINLYQDAFPTNISQFEMKLSNFYNVEEAALFSSSIEAMKNIIHIFLEDVKLAYIEENMNISWIHGLHSKYKIIRYEPDNLQRLEKLIKRHGSGMIISRSLSPYTGKYALLEALCKISEGNDCFLVVNETNTLGLIGEGGKGLANLYGLSSRIDFIIADFMPVFQVSVAIVLGRSLWISYLRNMSNYNYDISLTELKLNQLAYNFSLVKSISLYRSNLCKIAVYLHENLINYGFKVTSPIASHIICFSINLKDQDLKQSYISNLNNDMKATGIIINSYKLTANKKTLFTLHLNAGVTIHSLDKFINKLLNIYHTESNL